MSEILRTVRRGNQLHPALRELGRHSCLPDPSGTVQCLLDLAIQSRRLATPSTLLLQRLRVSFCAPHALSSELLSLQSSDNTTFQVSLRIKKEAAETRLLARTRHQKPAFGRADGSSSHRHQTSAEIRHTKGEFRCALTVSGRFWGIPVQVWASANSLLGSNSGRFLHLGRAGGMTMTMFLGALRKRLVLSQQDNCSQNKDLRPDCCLPQTIISQRPPGGTHLSLRGLPVDRPK